MPKTVAIGYYPILELGFNLRTLIVIKKNTQKRQSGHSIVNMSCSKNAKKYVQTRDNGSPAVALENNISSGLIKIWENRGRVNHPSIVARVHIGARLHLRWICVRRVFRCCLFLEHFVSGGL